MSFRRDLLGAMEALSPIGYQQAADTRQSFAA
jgi:hypothetical protein